MFVRAREIVPCTARAAVAQCGVTFDSLGLIAGGALLVHDGTIVAMGSESDVAPLAPADAGELDVRDCLVVPGFVDAHAHPLFAGDREPDFAARLRGEGPPQGMLETVRATRTALRDSGAFYEATVKQRLFAMLRHGTTTLETKTGYALCVDGEFELLDLIASHKDDPQGPRLISTFLAAHSVPPEYESARRYLDVLISDALPSARGHGAEYADIFCERGFFTAEESLRYLSEAKRCGLAVRMHCDELSASGGAAVALRLGADAVDHCNYLDASEVEAVAQRCVVVACPATVAFLDIPKRPPIRALLDRGGAVALASDFNPGTSPCYNLQSVAYFGRALFGLSAAEALYGVTVAGAHSLRSSVGKSAGRLEVGGRADLVALRLDDPREFGWQFGGNYAAAVMKNGRIFR